jgi:hypothetical protein
MDKNADRAQVPGQQPVPERDIEPLWPPDPAEQGAEVVPPWASGRVAAGRRTTDHGTVSRPSRRPRAAGRSGPATTVSVGLPVADRGGAASDRLGRQRSGRSERAGRGLGAGAAELASGRSAGHVARSCRAARTADSTAPARGGRARRA